MTVATIRREAALADDCVNADIVVSATPTRCLCHGPKLVIDRFDVARNGAYAVWFAEALRIETAEGERGARPWSYPPEDKTGKTQ